MPRDLFAENGINPGAQQGGVDLFAKNNINPNEKLVTQPSQAQTMSAGDQFLNGAGDALVNTYTAGLADPQRGAGFAYGAGKVAGNIGGFVGGGELLDSLRLAAKGLPYIGKVAGMLEGGGLQDATRRALGSAAYGADTNPDDRAKGALQGAAISGATEAIPGAFGLLGKAANAIRPQKYAQQITDIMGGGKTLEDNARSLAQDIKGSYEKRVQEGNALYSDIFDNLGSSSVYDGVKPSSSGYQTLDKDIIGSYDRNIGKLHQQFLENPTFQNAHNLQSQLGSAVRKLQGQDVKGNLSVADRSTMQGYQDAQEAVRGDINNFLNGKSPDAAAKYQAATQNWLDNVVPYIENSKIAPIAKGDITNPRNITNIFQKPEPEVQKIVDDMGDSAAHKILYSELGKYRSSATPDNLLNAYRGLSDKGLDSYVTPGLAKQFETLAGRVSNRNMVQRGAGALLGMSALHPIANSVPVSLLAAAGAGAFSPVAMRYLQNKLPVSQVADDLSKYSPKIYRSLSNATVANAVPGGQ